MSIMYNIKEKLCKGCSTFTDFLTPKNYYIKFNVSL